ncbi:MAG: STAS domain-containing protein [Gemmataceae bacterium]|nr:STAS domain-containing protein [Gemmataceae bacterium]
MTPIRSAEGTLVRCLVCDRDVALEPPVGALEGMPCPFCANLLSFDGAEALAIKLAAFPILDDTNMRVFDRLRRCLTTLQPRRMELDFAGVMFLSSAALSRLIMLAQTARTLPARLVLRHLEPMIQEVLEITRIRDLFDIEPAPDSP